MKTLLINMQRSLQRLYGRRESYYQNYYYKTFGQYNDVDTYAALYQKCSMSIAVKTHTGIFFSEDFTFNSVLKEIKSTLPKHTYHIKNKDVLNTDVLIYRTFIGKHKVKCQMHFFENKLFLYTYTFSNISQSQKNEILIIIQEKYGTDIKAYSNQTIVDSFDKCIQIIEGTELTINYVSLNNAFFKEVLLLTQLKEEEKIRKNDYYFNDLYTKL